MLGWRLVGPGGDQQARLADPVRLEFLDHDAVEEGSQVLAHVQSVGPAPVRVNAPRALLPSAGMINPLLRWAQYGEKPDFTGLLSFAGQPYTEDPDDLVGVDVAIVGAATDDLVSDRPGTRFAPRAIRAAGAPPGRHLSAGIDAFAALNVVDFGDAPVVPADAVATHAAIGRTVGQIVAAGAIPVILGGDHSIAEPDIRAVAERHGPVGLVHLDAHADTASTVFGTTRSHGTPMRHLVEDGIVDPIRYVQIGLRGYWPGEQEFAWQREQGITTLFMHGRHRAGDRGGRRPHDRRRRQRPGVPLDRHRRARPLGRPGNRHARARGDGGRGRAVGGALARAGARRSPAPSWSR